MLQSVLAKLPVGPKHLELVKNWGVLYNLNRYMTTITNEASIGSILRKRFPSATEIQVEDVSGGCGAMFNVWVESADFKSLSKVKQHRLVTEALKKEIKEMHGIRISTTVPEDS